MTGSCAEGNRLRLFSASSHHSPAGSE